MFSLECSQRLSRNYAGTREEQGGLLRTGQGDRIYCFNGMGKTRRGRLKRVGDGRGGRKEIWGETTLKAF